MIKIPVTEQRMLTGMRYGLSLSVRDLEMLVRRYDHSDNQERYLQILEACAAMNLAFKKLRILEDPLAKEVEGDAE